MSQRNEVKKELPAGRELVELIARSIYSNKAMEVMLLDLKGLSDVADYFVVATCGSSAQMQAVATGLIRDLRSQASLKPAGSEMREGSRWTVIDYGDVMVHLFEESERGRLSLERLWADAKVENLDEKDFVLIEDNGDDDEGYL